MIAVRRNLRNRHALHLHQLPSGQVAYVDSVDWDSLSPGEAQRLREFGVEEGATIEILHRAGLLGHGALACRIGRMTVAMRHGHADAIHVRTGFDAPVEEALSA